MIYGISPPSSSTDDFHPLFLLFSANSVEKVWAVEDEVEVISFAILSLTVIS